MATRLYISNAAVDQALPSVQGTWTASTNSNSGLLWLKAGAANTAAFTSPNSGDTDMLARFQSPPLAASQAFATTDTLTYVMGALLSTTTNTTVVWRVHVYVVESDGSTIRGTLLSNHNGATTWTGTATGQGDGAINLGANVTAQAGDRIVIEVGTSRTGSATQNRTLTMNYGNTGGTDLTQGSTSVTTQPGWIEFSTSFINNFSWIVSESESSAVSDTPTLSLTSFVNVTDSSAVSDVPTISEAALALLPSVSDSSAVSDTPTLSVTSFVSVTDSSAVTDTVQMSVRSFVSVTDSSAATESTAIVIIPILTPSVSDSTATTDTPTMAERSFVSVTDSTVVSESVVLEDIEEGVVVTDSSAVGESVKLETISYVPVADSTAVTDTAALLIIPVLVPSVSESTAAADSPTLSLTSKLAVEDDVAVSDSIGVTTVTGLSVTETTTMHDSVVVQRGSRFLNVSDSPSAHDAAPMLRVARPLSDFRPVRLTVSAVGYVAQLGWQATGYVMQMLD